jgi:hypothetical protein
MDKDRGGGERRFDEPGEVYIQERFNPHDVNGVAGKGSLLLTVEVVLPALVLCTLKNRNKTPMTRP